MALYAVHCASGAPADLAGARFVKQGFRFWAFVFAPLWLLAQRLWLAFVAWLVASLAVSGLLAGGLIDPAAASALGVLLALFVGFEGASLIDARLNRAGLAEVAIVGGRRREDAERAFYARALAEAALAPRAPSPPPPSPPSGGHGIIGLFPEAGR